VHGIEDGIAGFSEANGRDDIKVAIQLEDAGMFRIVVGAANANVQEAVRISVHTKDAAGCLSVLHAGPLPLKLTNSIEELKARIFPVGDKHIRAAGNKNEAMRVAELALTGSFLTPLLQPLSIAVEKGDAAVYITVGDIEGSVRTNSDVGWLIEMRGIPCSDARLSNREDELAVMSEFENLLQGNIGQEDVVLAVDANPMRNKKHVRAP